MILKICKGQKPLNFPYIFYRYITNLTPIGGEQRTVRFDDGMGISLRSCRNIQDIFQITSSQRNKLTGEHAMLSLKTIFLLQKEAVK